MDNFTDKDLQGVYDPNKSDTEALKQAMPHARPMLHDTAADNDFVMVPYFVHEAEVMRMEKHTRRLWVALLVAIIGILLTNAAWLWYINQYDFIDYEQDGEGVNIIGNSNEVENGTEIESTNEEEAQ